MYNKKPDRKRMKEQALKPVRIQPDRRWFGNTRVIAQEKMQQFRATKLQNETNSNIMDISFRLFYYEDNVGMDHYDDIAWIPLLFVLVIHPCYSLFGSNCQTARTVQPQRRQHMKASQYKGHTIVCAGVNKCQTRVRYLKTYKSKHLT